MLGLFRRPDSRFSFEMSKLSLKKLPGSDRREAPSTALPVPTHMGIDPAELGGDYSVCAACGSTANPHSDEQCERNQQRKPSIVP